MQYEQAVISDLPPRFIDTDIGWYVLTREEADLGPYPSLSEAKRALSHHIEHHEHISSRPVYDSFCGFHIHDPQTCRKSNCGRCAEAQALEQKWLAGW